MRYEESPGLFGAGVGQSTCAEFECELCKTVYNKGCGTDEDDSTGEWVRTERFAKLDICEGCFERIENAVLHRLGDLLPWVSRILSEKRGELQKLTKHLRLAEESAAGRPVDFEE